MGRKPHVARRRRPRARRRGRRHSAATGAPPCESPGLLRAAGRCLASWGWGFVRGIGVGVGRECTSLELRLMSHASTVNITGGGAHWRSSLCAAAGFQSRRAPHRGRFFPTLCTGYKHMLLATATGRTRTARSRSSRSKLLTVGTCMHSPFRSARGAEAGGATLHVAKRIGQRPPAQRVPVNRQRGGRRSDSQRPCHRPRPSPAHAQ